MYLSANFLPVFDNTLKKEGGFQNFPEDTANYCEKNLIGTKYGISAIGYKGFYGVCPTEAQIKALTQNEAFKIFKKKYWDKINGDKIANGSVAAMMFQFIIGSGASQLSDIKAIANVTAGKKIIAEVDYPFTDKEIELINALPQKTYWNNLKNWRKEFYKRLVAKVPEKKQFLNGWLKRLDSYSFVDGPNDAASTTSAIGYVKKNKKKLLIGGSALLLLGSAVYLYSQKRK